MVEILRKAENSEQVWRDESEIKILLTFKGKGVWAHIIKELLVFLGESKVKTLRYWRVRREELVCMCWPSGEVMVDVYL